MKFYDLKLQYRKIKKSIDKDLNRNFIDGDFIQGENVKRFEESILKYTNSKYSLSCANGTDALKIAIKALELKKNTYVIVPSYTWISTASSVIETGLKPLFCDVDLKSFVISPNSLKNCINFAKRNNYKISGVISVDLFGNPVDYYALKKICKKNNIKFISDAAQSFGAKFKNKYVGSGLCDALTTSFFPTKTLGCYGDGGAVFFNNLSTFKRARIFSKNGQYDGQILGSGINSRLDTIQASILLTKLKFFKTETLVRDKISRIYRENLTKKNYIFQDINIKNFSGNSVFTVFLKKHIDRNILIKYLKFNKIPYKIYYAEPIHKSKFYKKFPATSMENTLTLSKNTISLPIYPYLDTSQVLKICKILNSFDG